MTDQTKLKARLLKLKSALDSYACHGVGERYRVAAGYYAGWNRSDSTGARWIESLSAAGLRFVGWADELANLRHKGWYTDDSQSDVYRGAVVQLPARDGRPLYFPAYADPHNTDAFRVDCTSLVRGAWGGDDSVRSEVARMADSFAEREAEKERNYQEAWQLGSRYAALGDDIQSARRTALALIREIKAQGTFGPTICKTLRAQLESFRRTIRAARAERFKLRDVNPWWERTYGQAFNDGADETVFAV